MNLLAIESATDLAGAALLAGGAVAERSHEGGRAHAETLAPAIEEVCAVSGCTLADVDAIAVDVGPGLFTGLRVGVATAKALAQALGIGIVGVSSLDVLAAAAGGGTGGARTLLALVDARRGEVFAARYRIDPDPDTDPADRRLAPTALVRPDALVAALVAEGPAAPGEVAVVGDGAVRYRDLLATVPGLDLGGAAALAAPPPLALARLAARRLAAGAVPRPAVEIVPDYRREADARINWEQRIGPPAAAGTGERGT